MLRPPLIAFISPALRKRFTDDEIKAFTGADEVREVQPIPMKPRLLRLGKKRK